MTTLLMELAIAMSAFICSMTLHAACPEANLYTLRSFDLEDRFHSQNIRIALIEKRLKDRKADLSLSRSDLEDIRSLFYKGYATLDQLNAAEMQVEENEIERDRQVFSLEAVASEQDILERRARDACLKEPGDLDEIKEFAVIFHRKWQDSTRLDPREIALSEKKLKMSEKYLSWMKMMHSRGFKTRREYRIAQMERDEIKRLIVAQKTILTTKQEFIESLSKILES